VKAWKAELFLLLITTFWGGTFTFTKIGLVDSSPAVYIIIRFSIALIISFILFGKYLLKIDTDILKRGLVLGALFGGGFLLQTYGLKFTTVQKSAFITGVSVVLTPFAYWFVRRQSILIWQKLGVIIASIGLWIFTNPDFKNLNLGDILTLISTFFWAFYITYMDMFTKGEKEFSLTAQLVMLQFLTATPIAFSSFFIFDSGMIYLNISDSLLISLAFNGIIASFALTYIHTSVQRYSSPVKAALIFSLEPVFASIIAYFFLFEILSLREIWGALILFSGVMISELGEYLFKKL
jgi:drug/metabolite transporter (DMT)-like permease